MACAERRLYAGALALLVALLLPSRAVYGLPQFLARIPNGDAWSRNGSGIECQYLGHTGSPCFPGAPRNPFGLDFKAAGLKWTTELCEKDSDGDGVTNGEELGDPCCQWTPENPTTLRLTMLSHPGELDEDGAKDAPRCEAQTQLSTTAAPPVTPSPSASTSAASASSASSAPTLATSSPSPSSSASPAAAVASIESTPTITPEDDDNVCFPAHALVQLQDGSVRRMDQIDTGDVLLVADREYSTVFMFTHRQQHVLYPFVSLQIQHIERSLMLTAGHFVYSNGRCVPAATVKPGDLLYLADGSSSKVLNVSVKIARGLYNPQTIHGDLVVDGVRVTTYTTSVQKITAHSLLAPLRALYQVCAFCAPLFQYAPEQVRSVLS